MDNDLLASILGSNKPDRPASVELSKQMLIHQLVDLLGVDDAATTQERLTGLTQIPSLDDLRARAEDLGVDLAMDDASVQEAYNHLVELWNLVNNPDPEAAGDEQAEGAAPAAPLLPEALQRDEQLKPLLYFQRQLVAVSDFNYLANVDQMFGRPVEEALPSHPTAPAIRTVSQLNIWDRSGIEAYQGVLNHIAVTVNAVTAMYHGNLKNRNTPGTERNAVVEIQALGQRLEAAYRKKISEIWQVELKKVGIEFGDLAKDRLAYLKLLQYLRKERKLENSEDVEYIVNEITMLFPSLQIEQTVDEITAILEFVRAFENSGYPPIKREGVGITSIALSPDLVSPRIAEDEIQKTIKTDPIFQRWALISPTGMNPEILRVMAAVKALYINAARMIRDKDFAPEELIKNLISLSRFLATYRDKDFAEDIVPISPHLAQVFARLGLRFKLKIADNGLGIDSIDTYIPEVLRDAVEGVAVITMRDRFDLLAGDSFDYSNVTPTGKITNVSRNYTELLKAHQWLERYEILALDPKMDIRTNPYAWLGYEPRLVTEGKLEISLIRDIDQHLKEVDTQISFILANIDAISPELREKLSQVHAELGLRTIKKILLARLVASRELEKVKLFKNGADTRVELTVEELADLIANYPYLDTKVRAEAIEPRSLANLIPQIFEINPESASFFFNLFPLLKGFIEDEALVEKDDIKAEGSLIAFDTLDSSVMETRGGQPVSMAFLTNSRLLNELNTELGSLAEANTLNYGRIEDELMDLQANGLGKLNMDLVMAVQRDLDTAWERLNAQSRSPTLSVWTIAVSNLQDLTFKVSRAKEKIGKFVAAWEKLKQLIPAITDDMSGDQIASHIEAYIVSKVTEILSRDYTKATKGIAIRVLKLTPLLTLHMQGKKPLDASFSWMIGIGDDTAPGRLDIHLNQIQSSGAWVDLDLSDPAHVAMIMREYKSVQDYIAWLGSDPKRKQLLPTDFIPKLRELILERMKIFLESAFARAREIAKDELVPMTYMTKASDSAVAQNVKLIKFLRLPPAFTQMVYTAFPAWKNLSLNDQEDYNTLELQKFVSSLEPLQRDIYTLLGRDSRGYDEMLPLLKSSSPDPTELVKVLSGYFAAGRKMIAINSAFQKRDVAEDEYEYTLTFIAQLINTIGSLQQKVSLNAAVIPGDVIETRTLSLKRLFQDPKLVNLLTKYYYQQRLAAFDFTNSRGEPALQSLQALKEGKFTAELINSLLAPKRAYMVRMSDGSAVEIRLPDLLADLPADLLTAFNQFSGARLNFSGRTYTIQFAGDMVIRDQNADADADTDTPPVEPDPSDPAPWVLDPFDESWKDAITPIPSMSPKPTISLVSPPKSTPVISPTAPVPPLASPDALQEKVKKLGELVDKQIETFSATGLVEYYLRDIDQDSSVQIELAKGLLPHIIPVQDLGSYDVDVEGREVSIEQLTVDELEDLAENILFGRLTISSALRIFLKYLSSDPKFAGYANSKGLVWGQLVELLFLMSVSPDLKARVEAF